MSCLIIIIAMMAILLRIGPRKGNEDYMSRRMTQTVNGFFIVCVFFRHIFQYREFAGNAWTMTRWFDRNLGQFIVVTFLLFSGYGIMESWKKRGMAYIHRIPLHRFLQTWIRFVCCVLVYLGAAALEGEPYPLQRLPGILAGWYSAGNSNWYIFVILCLYLLTWAAFLMAERMTGKAGNREETLHMRTALLALALQLVFSALLAWILSDYQEDYWYNTIFVYTGGMAFSLIRPVWDDFFERSFVGNLIFWLVEGILWLLCYRMRELLVMYELAALLFAGAICWMMRVMDLKSRAFAWMGEHLFGLYMMQRLPMQLLAGSSLSDSAYLLVCGLLTLILGWIMDAGTRKCISVGSKKI